MTRSSIVAALASKAYGTSTTLSVFDPPTGAYGYNESTQSTYMNAYAGFLNKKMVVSTNYVAQPAIGPWPFNL